MKGSKKWKEIFEKIWTCTRNEDEPKAEPGPNQNLFKLGNYIKFYEIQSDKGRTITLSMVYTQYCTPKLEQCRCKSLLETLLDDRPDTIMIQGTFKAKPPIAGCKCYLGAAVKKGFKFVKMWGLRKKCQGKIDLSAEPYAKICETLVKNKCFGQAEIMKTDPDLEIRPSS